MLVGSLLVAAAAGLLWWSAELFVEHAASAGARLGVTGLAVGPLLAGGVDSRTDLLAGKGKGLVEFQLDLSDLAFRSTRAAISSPDRVMSAVVASGGS